VSVCARVEIEKEMSGFCLLFETVQSLPLWLWLSLSLSLDFACSSLSMEWVNPNTEENQRPINAGLEKEKKNHKCRGLA
jgi:hypothetical protein